jgi:hypothetical protein
MLNWWMRASNIDKIVIWFVLFFGVFTIVGGPAFVGQLYFGIQHANETLQQR